MKVDCGGGLWGTVSTGGERVWALGGRGSVPRARGVGLNGGWRWGCCSKITVLSIISNVDSTNLIFEC